MNLTPGQRVLNDYELVRFEARGSFGEVWEGRGPGGEPVAVKLVPRAGEEVTRAEKDAIRFIRENPHDGLVRVLAHDYQDATAVFVMEWAPQTLAARLEATGGTGIPAAELARYAQGVAAGLDFLGDHGWTHNDVKPANLLLAGGRAKVSDFGFAKRVLESIVEKSHKYTPLFAAPECLRGQTAKYRSDQYSLAVSYHWLRTGRFPFRGVGRDSSFADVLFAHLQADPVVEGVTPSEARALMRALAKEPGDRFSTCSEFVRELRADISPFGPGGGSMTQGVEESIAQLQDWAKAFEKHQAEERAQSARRWKVGAAVGTTLLLLIAFGVVAGLLIGPSRPPAAEPGPDHRAELAALSQQLKAVGERNEKLAGEVQDLRTKQLDAERRAEGANRELATLGRLIESDPLPGWRPFRPPAAGCIVYLPSKGQELVAPDAGAILTPLQQPGSEVRAYGAGNVFSGPLVFVFVFTYPSPITPPQQEGVISRVDAALKPIQGDAAKPVPAQLAGRDATEVVRVRSPKGPARSVSRILFVDARAYVVSISVFGDLKGWGEKEFFDSFELI